MKVTELRIGNMIYYNSTNGPGKLENKIDGEDIKIMYEKSDYLELHSSILLNERWLDRFGFKKKGILFEKGKFAIKKWDVGGLTEWIIFWGDVAVARKTDLTVHWLQNFYYDLTDEELT